MNKIPVAILGATGIVGQRFVALLADHPWFEVTAVAASERSAGRRYGEACRWLLPTPMPAAVRDLLLASVEPPLDARLVFSALPGEIAGPAEERLAHAGYAICSNASAHRMDGDVPLLIPEVNAEHTQLLAVQRRQRGWSGLLVTSANCSTTQLALALRPLHDAFGLRKVVAVTMQAISGAGHPGVPALDIADNVLPWIGGEEEKLEQEPRKLLGTLREDAVAAAPFVVSAQCNRVPVREGHTACVAVELARRPAEDEVWAALEAFAPPAEVADLPSSPARPLQVHREVDRPQPLRDRDTGGGMVVHVGRIRPCPVLHVRFVVLGHNTVRGAAGGAIHNAELLVAQGWI
jgi:aspartate-semialdehyde dehydrogenase